MLRSQAQDATRIPLPIPCRRREFRCRRFRQIAAKAMISRGFWSPIGRFCGAELRFSLMAGTSSMVPGGGFDRPPPGRFRPLLRRGADWRLVQHLGGLSGDDRTFEEIGVLRAPE